MIKSIALALSLAATSTSASSIQDAMLSLPRFQSILHTSLDDVLGKMNSLQQTNSIKVPHLRARCDGDDSCNKVSTTAKGLRGQKNVIDVAASSASSSSYSPEQFWSDLVEHGWNEVEELDYPCAFLVCSHDMHNFYDALVDERRSVMELPPSSSSSFYKNDDTHCFVETMTADNARLVAKYTEEAEVVPFVDILKVQSGVVDAVMLNKSNNITLAIDLVPGMHDENQSVFDPMSAPALIQMATEIIDDVHNMSKVGYIEREDDYDEERVDFTLEHSFPDLQDVPSLMETFSLTKIASNKEDEGVEVSPRLKFWDDALANGLESKDGCQQLLDTMIVHPIRNHQGAYESFSLNVASNDACVVSFIAGLSTHSWVLSIDIA